VIYKCAGLEAKVMPEHQYLFGGYWQREGVKENLETSPDKIPMAEKMEARLAASSNTQRRAV